MINLIKNEFIKLFKKKNILIMFLIVFGFILLNNILYKNTNNQSYYSSYHYTEETKDSIKSYLDTLDPNSPSDAKSYVENRVEYEVASLVVKYGTNSWQTNIVMSHLYPLLYELYEYQYLENNYTEKEFKEKEQKLSGILEKLETNDWKYFATNEKIEHENTIATLKSQKSTEQDTAVLKEIEQSIQYTTLSLEVANYRLNQNIDYSQSYLNTALEEYQNYKSMLINLDKTNLTYAEKLENQQALEKVELAKYIIENKQNIDQVNAHSQLINSVRDYQILILFVVIMVAAGIVADEFNKGTIKLLLIKPYERRKILASKYITSFLMIFITILLTIFLQFIIGGITFGFDSLSLSALLYNFTSGLVETFNIPMMILINTVQLLPLFILIMTLAFSISTIFTSSALAIALPLVGLFVSELINALAINYNIIILKYFVTLNWDLGSFAFGRLPSFETTNMTSAIIICSIYTIIMLVTTFIVFKKKNIKNI